MSELAPMGPASRLDLGVLPTRTARAERDPRENEVQEAPTRCCGLRARARAAARAVEGGGDAALDAAIDIVTEELDALLRRLEQQKEALKILGLYASDDWSRSMARQALDHREPCITGALPDFLYDHDLACSCQDAAVHRDPRPRA